MGRIMGWPWDVIYATGYPMCHPMEGSTGHPVGMTSNGKPMEHCVGHTIGYLIVHYMGHPTESITHGYIPPDFPGLRILKQIEPSRTKPKQSKPRRYEC